jgi:hypothetical protein
MPPLESGLLVVKENPGLDEGTSRSGKKFTTRGTALTTHNGARLFLNTHDLP